MRGDAARTLRFELLGGFRAFARGKPVGRALTTRQQELLAYLALNRAAPVLRQQIAGRFWPESTDAQALTNLRRELHHVRHALPEIESILDAGTRTLEWTAHDVFDLDVAEFERAAARGLDQPAAGTGGTARSSAIKEAAALYHGDLLPGCDDEWIRPERERLRRRFGEVLARLVERLEHDHAYSEAADYAQRLLAIDPVHEGTWRILMRCHARRGDRATALHVYQRCAATLKRELGVQPGPATRLVYRELLEDDTSAPMAAPPAPRTATYPLVGRQAEWSTLLQAWQAAASGQGGALLIRGEAGIGKSRLSEELLDWAAARGVRVAATRCYAGEGRLAYAPIAAWLREPALQPAFSPLDPVWLTEIARLHPELLRARSDIPAPEPRIESWRRSRFFEALAHAFAAASPLLLVVDDLQWCDPDTLEWLHFFFRWTEDRRALVVGTVRSEEEGDNAAFGVLLRELDRLERLTVVNLGPLDAQATARLAEAVAEQPLDRRMQARVFAQTEGQPLFIVETGRMSLTASAPTEALPPRVQAVVAARLVQLSPDARSVAELAAAVGRDFTFDILAHVSDLEESAVVRALDELWQRQVVRAQGADAWDFSHDRIREVAYQGIGPARRRLLHRRIAQALEQLSAWKLDEVSASIAAHLEHAGQAARAVSFFERAAEVAVRVSANEEAIRCLRRALALIEEMPDGPERAERELAIRGALSGPLTAARGYAAPEVEANLERIAVLSTAAAGAVPVRWLWTMWAMRFVQGDLASGRALAEQAMSQAAGDPACACEAHHALAGALASMGELEASRRHFEAAIAAYDEGHPQSSALGSDLGMFAHAWFSHPLWLLGAAAEARAHAERAIALADRSDHPYNQTIAHAYASLTFQLLGDIVSARRSAELVVGLSERHGFAYYGDWARVVLGWVLGQEQRSGEGVALIEAAIESLDRQHAMARRPYYLSLLADACLKNGQIDRAREVLDRAMTLAFAGEDSWWTAELLRQKSELETGEAADALRVRALELARAQGSTALEERVQKLRTVTRTVAERSHL